jgi:hypothetical protein
VVRDSGGGDDDHGGHQSPSLHVELIVLDVRELDLQACGAAAAVAEVDLAERFGRESAQLLFAGALILGVEEAGGVLRGQARVRWRMRASSVVPGVAVKPKRARASRTSPVLVAACLRAWARMRGCQRTRTAHRGRAAAGYVGSGFLFRRFSAGRYPVPPASAD